MNLHQETAETGHNSYALYELWDFLLMLLQALMCLHSFVFTMEAQVWALLSPGRLSQWVVDAIHHTAPSGFQSLVPVGMHCHSNRSVSTSWAALRGVPLQDIRATASWMSPSMLSRFCNVNGTTPHPLGRVLQCSEAS